MGGMICHESDKVTLPIILHSPPPPPLTSLAMKDSMVMIMSGFCYQPILPPVQMVVPVSPLTLNCLVHSSFI